MHFKHKANCNFSFAQNKLTLSPLMEKKIIPAKSRLIYSSSPAAPPPSPVPTGKGSRSAASSFLSEYIDKSIRIPQLNLPQQISRSKPEEISYESIRLREIDSLRGLLRSAREFGAFRIIDHGISTDELRLALANCERVFGLTVECCTSYGDHEKLVWSGDGDGDFQVVSEEASSMIGEGDFQIFRQEMENVANQLEEIADELANVLAQGARKQIIEPIHLGKSAMSIYRYHRANINNRISSVNEERSQESVPYALSLHLLLESGELCQYPDTGDLSFFVNDSTVVVTIGKELEEWSLGELKSAQGELVFKPFLHTSSPSFSIKQKWSSTRKAVQDEPNKIISLFYQFFILAFLYNIYAYFVLYIYIRSLISTHSGLVYKGFDRSVS